MSTILTQESLALIETRATAAELVLKSAVAEIVRVTIKSCRYNQSKAALALGVSRGTMIKLLETHFPGEYVTHKAKTTRSRL